MGRGTRPHWHVDLKWVSGLLLVPLVGSALLVHSLVQITAEKPALDTMALATALMFSRNGLDDDAEIVAMRGALAATTSGRLRPIPGLRLDVTAADLAGASPREIRLRFFRRLVAPLYREGPAGLAELADDAEMKRRLRDGAGPLGLLSLSTHRTLGAALNGLLAVCLILFIPLIYFSRRFGRIGSVGIVLLTASLPGALAGLALSAAPQPAAPPGPEAEITAMVFYLVAHLAPAWGQIIATAFVPALAGGFALVLLGLVGNLIWWLFRRGTPAPGIRPRTSAEPLQTSD